MIRIALNPSFKKIGSLSSQNKLITITRINQVFPATFLHQQLACNCQELCNQLCTCLQLRVMLRPQLFQFEITFFLDIARSIVWLLCMSSALAFMLQTPILIPSKIKPWLQRPLNHSVMDNSELQTQRGEIFIAMLC